MSNELKLFTNGEVTTKDGREFTRLVGGLGKNKPVITDKQIAELLGYKKGAREVRERVSKNIKHFENGVHMEDLKRVLQTDTLIETLISLDYAKQSITQAKNIYIFSQAGFLLFLKFAEGDKAVEIYKNFIEDYFKTKAENKNMKLSIEEEIQQLKEDKKSLLGEMFMESDETRKISLFNKNEKLNNRITELEKSMSEKETLKKLQPELSIVDKFTNSDGYYDLKVFSKILDIENMGRNKLFKWMRDQKIFMKNNEPYQKYMDYFKVFPVTSKSGMIFNKTMIKPKGITYIFKKLIQDNKIIPKSIDEVIEELKTA